MTEIDNQKSLDEAIKTHLAALESAVAQKDQEGEASARVQLGQTYLLGGNYESASENFEIALLTAGQLGLAAIELQALYGLTQAAAGANQRNLAVSYGERVIDKARLVNAHAEEVQAIQTITGILSEHREFGKTIPYLLRGLEIVQEIRENDWALKFLSDLGMAYYLNDDLPNAASYMQKAYDHATRSQKKLEEAVLAGRLASVRADMGNLAIAVELNKHAVELAEELDDPMLKAEQLVLLAMNHLELDAAGEAEVRLQQAKKIYLALDEIKFLVQVEKMLHEIRNQKGL